MLSGTGEIDFEATVTNFMHFFEFCQFVMDMDLIAFIDLIDFIDLTERGGRNRLAPTHPPTHVMPQNGRIKKQPLLTPSQTLTL